MKRTILSAMLAVVLGAGVLPPLALEVQDALLGVGELGHEHTVPGPSDNRTRSEYAAR